MVFSRGPIARLVYRLLVETDQGSPPAGLRDIKALLLAVICSFIFQSHPV